MRPTLLRTAAATAAAFAKRTPTRKYSHASTLVQNIARAVQAEPLTKKIERPYNPLAAEFVKQDADPSTANQVAYAIESGQINPPSNSPNLFSQAVRLVAAAQKQAVEAGVVSPGYPSC